VPGGLTFCAPPSYWKKMPATSAPRERRSHCLPAILKPSAGRSRCGRYLIRSPTWGPRGRKPEPGRTQLSDGSPNLSASPPGPDLWIRGAPEHGRIMPEDSRRRVPVGRAHGAPGDCTSFPMTLRRGTEVLLTPRPVNERKESGACPENEGLVPLHSRSTAVVWVARRLPRESDRALRPLVGRGGAEAQGSQWIPGWRVL
jgi:hypothetical protein